MAKTPARTRKPRRPAKLTRDAHIYVLLNDLCRAQLAFEGLFLRLGAYCERESLEIPDCWKD